MMTLTKVVGVILALAASSAALAGPAEEANAVIDSWIRSFSANDPVAVVKLYASDAVLLGTVSPTIAENPDQVKAYFARLPGSGNKVEIKERRTIVLSDSAVLGTGFYEFTPVIEGKPTPFPARFTLVIAKRDDGWKIVHHHSSQRPRPPQ